MAEKMDPKAEIAYRAVLRRAEVPITYIYHGPYDSYGKAKAQVTREKNRINNVYDGWVERTELDWKVT